MEEKILSMLETMNTKINSMDETLQEHTKILHEHSEILQQHSVQFREHGMILTSLRSGQETLHAELHGFKDQHAKDMEKERKQAMKNVDSIEVLREDTWHNKRDIQRIKKTIGIS